MGQQRRDGPRRGEGGLGYRDRAHVRILTGGYDSEPGAAQEAAGHIPGALSVPLADLDGPRLADLPADREIVAYCRGPYCVMATEAVALLRGAGLRARHLDGGLPEWRLEGRLVVSGADGSAA